ncbi:MAG: response regulator transcription factor [Prevotella sp.]|nr:response regulator transcription factor [Prevotella sp.]
MKAIIVDDSIAAIEALKAKLKESYHDIQVVATATNGNEGLTLVRNSNPDLLFLDIELPDISGLDFLCQMRNSSNNWCHVIIYTSYSNYMLPAFRNYAFDFLQKPIEDKDLEAVMQRFYTDYQQPHLNNNKYDMQNQGNGKLLFYINSIDFCLITIKDIGLFRYNHDLRVWEIIVNGRKNIIRLKRNTQKESILNISDTFVQVHQKYIININYLMEVTDNVCRFFPPFSNLDYVKVGRLYRKRLLNNFLGVNSF